MKSGVDLTNVLENDEDNEETNCTDAIDEAIKSDEENMNSMENAENSLVSENKDSKDDRNNSKEENEVSKELESSSKGKVKGSLLLNYCKSANRSYTLVFVIASFLMAQAFASIADVWVSFWIRKEEHRQHHLQSMYYYHENATNSFSYSDIDLWPTETFVYIYSGIMLVFFIITSARSATFSSMCAAASQNLHDSMFRGLISTPMKFFDDNPAGRIMNRFTKDMGSVDETLPKVMLDALQNNLTIFGAIIVTIFTDLKLAIVILLMSGLFIVVRKIYLRSSKNIKRLEGISMCNVHFACPIDIIVHLLSMFEVLIVLILDF